MHVRSLKSINLSLKNTVILGECQTPEIERIMEPNLSSVIPTRYFLGRPDIGEEMHISIEKGKTLIIRLMAVGPVVEDRAQRDVWFEVNGEVSPQNLFDNLIRMFDRFVLFRSRIRIRLSRHFRGRRRRMSPDLSVHQCLVLLSRSG